MAKAKFQDLTDNVYNSLTAVRMIRWEAGKGFIWLFRCVCGKEVELRQVHAISGHTKSCGCRRKSTKINFPPPCTKCGVVHERRTHNGGYTRLCQTCFNKEQNHSAHPPKYLLARARDRANIFGLPFNLAEEDIVIPELCPILGTKLSYGGMSKRDSSPSLDKIKPALGYVKGNVAVISSRANRIKNNGTADEHRRIADWMDDQTQSTQEFTVIDPKLIEWGRELGARLKESMKHTIAKATTEATLIPVDSYFDKNPLLAPMSLSQLQTKEAA